MMKDVDWAAKIQKVDSEIAVTDKDIAEATSPALLRSLKLKRDSLLRSRGWYVKRSHGGSKPVRSGPVQALGVQVAEEITSSEAH